MALPQLIDAPDAPGRGFVSVWEPPREHVEYCIGVDPSHNLPHSGDFSVAVVWQRMPERIVARLRGDAWRKPDSDEFHDHLYALGMWYNHADILIERNGIGQSVIDALQSSRVFYTQYPNLITEDVLFPMIHKARGPVGLNMTNNLRRSVLDRLRQLVHSRDAWLPDEVMLRECQALQTVDKRGKVAAPFKGHPRNEGDDEVGFYDDLAMAAAIGYYAHLHLPAARSPRENQDRFERRELRRTHDPTLPAHLRKGDSQGSMNYDALGV